MDNRLRSYADFTPAGAGEDTGGEESTGSGWDRVNRPAVTSGAVGCPWRGAAGATTRAQPGEGPKPKYVT
jgi:hypothetical protein